ncbi:MAG: Tetratricopeptide repeat protein [Elusimicrobia bacterium ADurb.Bin231]|nr:MAG: Tetratricopeptide repeat protein [Elusimicrobia bacterium ADurb.Bin231]
MRRFKKCVKMKSFINGLRIIFLILCLYLIGKFAYSRYDFPYAGAGDIAGYDMQPVDFAGFALGMRRIFADITWIKTLQYYGGEGYDDIVAGESYKKYENDPHRRGEYGRYSRFLDMCRKTVKFDPHFTYVYLFGSSSLAWNLTRYDEALELLNEGIEHNPHYYPFHIYAAAIVYAKENNYARVIEKLELAVKYPDCPFEVKVILGNIYEKNGRFADSAEIWLGIMENSRNKAHIARAQKKLQELLENGKNLQNEKSINELSRH